MLLVIGLLLIVRYYRREFSTISVSDVRRLRDTPETRVNELKPGLVKLVGVARAEQGVMSYFERQPCILHRRVVTTISGYERVGRVTYMKTFTAQEWTAIPFQLDDGTGTIWVDPRMPDTRVDYELGTTDEENPVQEQYIRLGDKVSVMGEIEMLPSADGYRERGQTADASQYARFKGPVLISWRSEPECLPKTTPPWAAVALGCVGACGVIAAAMEGQVALLGITSTATVIMGAAVAVRVFR